MDPVTLAVGRLVASLHVLRSIPSGLHPTTQAAYDELRDVIHDFGWSTAEEIAERVQRALSKENEHADQD